MRRVLRRLGGVVRYMTVYKGDSGKRLANLRRVMWGYGKAGIEVGVYGAEGARGQAFGFNFWLGRYIRGNEWGVEDVVVVIEADCWVRPGQVGEAVELCRRGYVMALAYDGKVWQWRARKGWGLISDCARGGVYALNVRRYIDLCGGENPNVIPAGEEDLERYERISKVMTVPMVSGRLLHLTHPRTLTNLLINENADRELIKVRRMDWREQEAYIKTWK